MSKQNKENLEIRDYITRWIVNVTLSNASNYFDINRVSEGICMKLLNLIYGYELKDLNKTKLNFPAVDLGDTTLFKIAFQITSEMTRSKIKESLMKFKKHDLHKEFTGGIKFLFLKENKIRKNTIKGYEDVFNIATDIIFPSDLIKEINDIYYKDFDKYVKIKGFLQVEFGDANKNDSSLIYKDDESKLESYIEIIKNNSSIELKQFVHFFVQRKNIQYNTEILINESFENKGTILIGESGYGKSILAIAWTTSLCYNGKVPVILKAKYFESGLTDLLDREVKLYGFSSALTFLDVCIYLEKKIILVIDGLNECLKSRTELLVSELKNFSIKYAIPYLITTQYILESIDCDENEIIKVCKPDSELKLAIAQKYSTNTVKLAPILNIVSTALEAKIVGEIGEIGVDNISRYSLFELYLRKKLSERETDSIILLSSIARLMSQEFTFSISLRQVERILSENKMDSQILEYILINGILVKNFTKVSFTHEMLMNFFIVENITRVELSLDQLIFEFNLPKNEVNKLLIIGAIDNSLLRKNLLESVTDSKILDLLLQGEGGEYCKQWTIARLKQVLKKLKAGPENFSFEIDSSNHIMLKIDQVLSCDYTDQERAFVDVIPYQLVKGNLLEDFFLILKAVDDQCIVAFNDHWEEAREKKLGLRSGLFQLFYGSVYGITNEQYPILRIFNALYSSFTTFYTIYDITVEQLSVLALNKNLTNGQFYFLLLICRYSERSKILYSIIIKKLKEEWDYQPYGLKLEILEILPHCYSDDYELKCLVEVLNDIHIRNTNEWLSITIFNVLRNLGVFTSDAEKYRETVKEKLEKLFENPNIKESWKEACYLFRAQYDHPYDSAFSYTLESLDEKSKEIFYSMCLQDKDDVLFFVPALIFKAEEVLGASCCKYLIKHFNNSLQENEFTDENLKIIIIIAAIWAKYNYNFHIEYKTSEVYKIISASVTLFYWINRHDLERDKILEKSKSAINVLFETKSDFTLDAIRELDFAVGQAFFPDRFVNNIVLLSDFFHEEILEECRTLIIKKLLPQTIFFYSSSSKVFTYAINKIGVLGDLSDIETLKSFTMDLKFGQDALKSLNNIKNKSF